MRLPAFVSSESEAALEAVTLEDVADGFALSGFFLSRHVLQPRNLSFAEAREGYWPRCWDAAATPGNEGQLVLTLKHHGVPQAMVTQWRS